MMLYVAVRILLYDKSRSLITLVGVVFAVSLIFNQLGIFMGLMETSSVIIDHTAGDIWITSKNSKNFDFAQPFPEYVHELVLSEPGVEWAEKLIVAWGIIKQKEGGTEQVELVGFNVDSGVGGPWDMQQGSVSQLKNGNFAIIDESSMARLGAIGIGEYRDVLSRRVQIVGICRGVKSFTTAPIMYTSFALAQGLINYFPSESTVFIVAKVRPGVSATVVAKRLAKRLTGNDVYTKHEFSTKTRRYWAIETGVGFSFLLTIVISFLVGILIVGQTIYNSTMEHIKEFGTLKAMGADNRTIYRIILSQALINALLGYLISLIITMLTVGLYDALGMILVVRWWINLVVLTLTLGMCIIATVISIRRIQRIDPAILFRG